MLAGSPAANGCFVFLCMDGNEPVDWTAEPDLGAISLEAIGRELAELAGPGEPACIDELVGVVSRIRLLSAGNPIDAICIWADVLRRIDGAPLSHGGADLIYRG